MRLSCWLPASIHPCAYTNIYMDASCSYRNIHQHFHAQPDAYINADSNRHAYSRPDEHPVHARAGISWQRHCGPE
jgi:hypothetical protein